jgi:hypothetical protein
MAALKALAFLIAAVVMLTIESLRPSSGAEDDDVGLFIGSAHPLAAEAEVARRRRSGN